MSEPNLVAVLSRIVLCSLIPLASASALAASTSADRIVRAVDPTERVALPERRAAWMSPANDAGAVPADLPLTHLGIVLKRPPERQLAFEQLLHDQQDPASPDYQRWLSPREIGERFGATPHDIAAITDWLRAQGLSADSVSNSRTRIGFSGTAAAVSSAFATSMRYYRAAGETRIATATDAQIPAAFADAIAHVAGLRAVRYQPTLHTTAPIHAAAAGPEPAATYCPGTQPCQYNIFPADFGVIYNVNPLYQLGVKGSGQTIAVVGRSRIYQADVDHFRSLSGLDADTPVTIVPPDGSDPGPALTTCSDTSSPSCGNPSDALNDQSEATLDVQRAGSVAPDATIDLIASADTNSVDGVNIAIDYAVDNDPVPAKILSISFTSCEADNSRDVAASLDDFFGQAAAEGISVFVASGDAGVAGCASLDSAPQPGEPKSTNILCASQYVTCVGGTEFADAENPGAYWHSTNAAHFLSAIGYIPEGSWNEPLDSHGSPQLAASGGGVSAYLPKPSWQTGPGVPGSAGRYTPDVSLHAATREGYFMCVAAQNGPCVVGTNGTFSFLASGGTSATAPGLAGIAALLNQKTGVAHGNINPRLYSLAGDAAAAAFHDVTVASSGVAGCSVTVPSMCNNSTPGPSGLGGGLAGYLVGAGYDEATGLGSVNAANLVTHWNVNSGGAVDIDQIGISGSWYNPATSGQGVLIDLSPDANGVGHGFLFGGWFTYDTTVQGGVRWYSLQGTVDAGQTSVTVSIYSNQGGNFAAPPTTFAEQVGSAILAFSDCSHGALAYTFTDASARSGSIPLTRLGANVSCQPGGAAPPPATALFSGTYGVDNLGGQGFLFDLNPASRSFFGAWFTYAPDGAVIPGPAGQRWYSLQGTLTPSASAIDDIVIYATSGGVFDDPAHVVTTPVGTATLQFVTCTMAGFHYEFTSGVNAGRSDTITVFRALPGATYCGN